MKLYEISEIYDKALSELIDADEQTFLDTMEALEGEFVEKGRNVAAYFQNLDAEVAAMKEAEKRIAQRRKAVENKAARLREYLRENMQRLGITKIECPEFSVTLGKPSPVVVVDDVDQLPDEFVKITKTANKTALKTALKTGEVKGAHLEDGKPRLLIK